MDTEAIEARLADIESRLLAIENGFSVVFISGDETSEGQRTIEVTPGDVLEIPPQVIRVRTYDVDGKPKGQPLFDRAPLGQPLKIRFNDQEKGSD